MLVQLTNRIGVRCCLAGMMALAFHLPAGAEPAKEKDKEKVYLEAAVDFSPVATKLEEISKLMLVSVTAMSQQIANLEKPMRDNAELLKQLGEQAKRLERLEESVNTIQKFVKPPMGYEYKFLRTASERQANELGATGWSLVTTIRDEWMIFQKPVYGQMTVPTPAPAPEPEMDDAKKSKKKEE